MKSKYFDWVPGQWLTLLCSPWSGDIVDVRPHPASLCTQSRVLLAPRRPFTGLGRESARLRSGRAHGPRGGGFDVRLLAGRGGVPGRFPPPSWTLVLKTAASLLQDEQTGPRGRLSGADRPASLPVNPRARSRAEPPAAAQQPLPTAPCPSQVARW